ncbi:AraC family transcriptional regulator [Streptomyces sp. NPDC005438]|uniref:helix-turn-helix transcriptional regulator n=1 Tax=Streptomyces sp. NPDC005438 TaxID=3156880 RepID=UPI0033B2A1D7
METGSSCSGPEEWARHWRHPELPGVDLLRARYLRHTFPRHAHQGYVIGAIVHGVERVGMPHGVERVGVGQIVLINPEVAHSARAETAQGWAYYTLYPTERLVRELASEFSTVTGTLGFDQSVITDSVSVRLVTAVHRAAEEGHGLAADSLLRMTVARLVTRYARGTGTREVPGAGARSAARAREILGSRMQRPPTLEVLARELSVSPYALLRAFRERYGMPPHSWLTSERVRRARALLESGVPPAEVAPTVGFTDQAHLGRHFSRIVGVPPGAYQRERATR